MTTVCLDVFRRSKRYPKNRWLSRFSWPVNHCCTYLFFFVFVFLCPTLSVVSYWKLESTNWAKWKTPFPRQAWGSLGVAVSSPREEKTEREGESRLVLTYLMKRVTEQRRSHTIELRHSSVLYDYALKFWRTKTAHHGHRLIRGRERHFQAISLIQVVQHRQRLAFFSLPWISPKQFRANLKTLSSRVGSVLHLLVAKVEVCFACFHVIFVSNQAKHWSIMSIVFS